MARFELNRRDLLRGLGASVALPWLPSLARADAGEVPKRLLVFFYPNGTLMKKFTPIGEGTSFSWNNISAPLNVVRPKVRFLSNLQGYPAPVEPHHMTGSILTGVETPGYEDYGVRASISVDQKIAQAIGHHTRFPSLTLGTTTLPLDCDASVEASVSRCAFMWNVSWADSETPIPKQTDARALYQQLFGEGFVASPEERLARRLRRTSAVDRASARGKSLTDKLSVPDRVRLEAYLDALSELRTEIEAPTAVESCRTDVPTVVLEEDESGAMTLPQHVKAMLDLSVAALQCDQTRVITYMLGSGRSRRAFPFLNVPDAHHTISHWGDHPWYEKICRWEIEQLAYLLRKLDSIPESDGGTLLDHTIVLGISSMGDGTQHDETSVPAVLAGGGAWATRGGSHVLYERGEHTVADLHLALCRAYGLQINSFGEDGTNAIPLK